MASLAAVLAATDVAATATAAETDPAKELSSRRAAMTAGSGEMTNEALAREHYLLGVWARDRGLVEEARAEFQAAVKADPDHGASREALGQVRCGEEWISLAEAMERKGLVLRDGKWILREEAAALDLPAQERARRRDEQRKVTKLLSIYASSDAERARKYALESLGTIDDAVKFEPFAWALRSKSDGLRVLAAKELGRLADRRALRPLLWRSVHDPVEEVRYAAMDAAKAIGDPNLAVPLVGALDSESAQIRMNAANAIARLGDVRGVRYLVYRYEAHGGGGPRVYSMFANQLTFIQDFDVEVAQTAFIADPHVGIIQEGLVLDVVVVATSQVSEFVEREAIHGALQRLTGATDVPNKSGAWAKWFAEHEKELTAAR